MSRAKNPSIGILKKTDGAARIGFGEKTVAEGLNERPEVVASLAALAALTGADQKRVIVSGERAALYEFDSGDLSQAITDNPEPGFFVAPASDSTGASGAWVKKDSQPVTKAKNSPVFIEQFVNGFGGRGMLNEETPNVTTEQAITAPASKGATSIAVTDTTNLAAGGRVTIYHDIDDRYESYFVVNLSASSVGIAPGLKFPVSTNSKIERTWYNKAHPGKFYMRQLAQRVARCTEREGQTPEAGRLYFSQFDSDPTTANDQATAINGAGIAYIDELNVSQGLKSVPLESSMGRALFVTVDANGEGATLPEFATYGATQAVISAVIMCRSNAPDLVIRVKDTAGFIHAEWPVPKETQRVATKYQFPAKLPASTKKAKIEIVAKAGVTGSVAVIVDQVDVFAVTGATDRPVIEPDRRAVVVALGDSWIAGDLASTAEREPMTKQLVKELPLCRVINAGVGGNKVQDLLDRFDTDVVPHKPDYVVINTGTNDAYNPASGVFFPNSVDFFEYTYSQLLHKVMEIGARPIILGVPGLAEEDGTKVNWELNDRAKTYNRYFQKRISAVPEYVPEQAASLTAWTPILKIGGVSTGITYARQSGFYERRGPWVHFTLDLEMTAKGVETGAVTVGGFPIAAKSGVIVPVATTAINVAGSAAMQGVLNIGEANEIRLQIQPSTGSAAADETNITDNTRLIMAGKYPAFDA